MSRKAKAPRELKHFTLVPKPNKPMDPAEFLAELKRAHEKLGELIAKLEAE